MTWFVQRICLIHFYPDSGGSVLMGLAVKNTALLLLNFWVRMA